MDEFIKAILPGSGEAIRRLQEDIGRVNDNTKETRTILLLGEPGVGKSHIARLICEHRCWKEHRFKKAFSTPPRSDEIEKQKGMYVESRGKDILEHSDRPFASVLVPTLEGDMGLSTLFGHLKGAFTGASQARIGCFGRPANIDICLDEIGYASRTLQQRLLQICQSGEFTPLGSDDLRKSDARIIFATNQDLKALVEAGNVQPDLYWRMLNYVIEIPPLRQRRDEISNLCRQLLDQQKIQALDDVLLQSEYKFAPADLDWATNAYAWPGNVRELQQCINRWLLFRGNKSLQKVSGELQPYLPADQPQSFFTSNQPSLIAYYEERLYSAAQGKIAMGTLPQEIESVAASPLQQARAALVQAVDNAQRRHPRILSKVFGSKAAAARVALTKLRRSVS